MLLTTNICARPLAVGAAYQSAAIFVCFKAHQRLALLSTLLSAALMLTTTMPAEDLTTQTPEMETTEDIVLLMGDAALVQAWPNHFSSQLSNKVPADLVIRIIRRCHRASYGETNPDLPVFLLLDALSVYGLTEPDGFVMF